MRIPPNLYVRDEGHIVCELTSRLIPVLQVPQNGPSMDMLEPRPLQKEAADAPEYRSCDWSPIL